jgi:hypothetical protein
MAGGVVRVPDEAVLVRHHVGVRRGVEQLLEAAPVGVRPGDRLDERFVLCAQLFARHLELLDDSLELDARFVSPSILRGFVEALAGFRHPEANHVRRFGRFAGSVGHVDSDPMLALTPALRPPTPPAIPPSS